MESAAYFGRVENYDDKEKADEEDLEETPKTSDSSEELSLDIKKNTN